MGDCVGMNLRGEQVSTRIAIDQRGRFPFGIGYHLVIDRYPAGRKTDAPFMRRCPPSADSRSISETMIRKRRAAAAYRDTVVRLFKADPSQIARQY